MLNKFADIFKVGDLKKKILFTLGVLAVYRLGATIPVPGIDVATLQAFFQAESGSLFGFLDMFSGGALMRLSVFALGIMPFINASIIMSLLRTSIPYLEKLQKEGEAGRKKINQITRYFAVAIAAVQGFGLTFWMQSMEVGGAKVVINPGIKFQLVTVLTLVAGTIFIMWLGEQISESGIGNGISLIIFTGIVARLPAGINNVFKLIRVDEMSLFSALFLLAIVILITAAVVFVEQGQRKIPVQYAKRVVGRKMYGGQSTVLPLKVDQSGVIAVIFSMAVLLLPVQLAQFFPDSAVFAGLSRYLTPGTLVRSAVYAALIIFFCYFYTALTFNPRDIAENMKKMGGFIPGIRPGKPTAGYIDRVLTRITLVGALFVVVIAIMPSYFDKLFKAPFYFGGTALLIVVGVALDTMSQIESQLIMRHYEGFMKKGRLKGRGFNLG
ncbi:MAG: preprotein translocase subunit SecY [Elusimicrobiota bacterium]|nr:preprotein translocase subunit SecY [Elusimicrobiota bacterium]